MKITQDYLAKILRSRRFYQRLKEAGSFTYDTGREAGFSLFKDMGKSSFYLGKIIEGNYHSMANPDGDWAESIQMSAGENNPVRGNKYELIDLHYHPEGSSPIVPSLHFNAPYGEPTGDIIVLADGRRMIREELCDVKPIAAIGKMREPSKIDLLLVQERTDYPIGYGGLSETESALCGFYHYEIGSSKSLDESFQITEEVADALRGTEYYAAEQIRFRSGKPLKEDLEKLASFEFEEKRLRENMMFAF